MDTERKEAETALAKQKQQAAADLAAAVEEVKRPKFEHRSEVLSSGTVTMPAGTVKAFEVSVDSSIMQNFELSGRFEAKGGVGDDIQVLVFDHDNYVNWSTGHPSQHIFDSGYCDIPFFDPAPEILRSSRGDQRKRRRVCKRGWHRGAISALWESTRRLVRLP